MSPILSAAPSGAITSQLRIALLPDPRVLAVMVVGHDQEGRPAIGLQRRHLQRVQGDGAEDDQPLVEQPHHGHPPRQLADRHPDPADHGQQVVLDLGQFAVGQHGPLGERRAHRTGLLAVVRDRNHPRR